MAPPPSCSSKASKTSSSGSSRNQSECTFYYLYLITTSLLLLITLNSLSATHPHPHRAPPQIITFHPLRDPTVPPYTHPNKTWFMSTLVGPRAAGMPEHFLLPSPAHPHTLCISPRNKSYALIAAPPPTINNTFNLLRGLTFVADSYYDYENPWHGLNVVAPFFAWTREEERAGKCATPRRWVLFKSGEVVRRVGKWVESLVEAASTGEAEAEHDGLRGVGDDHEEVVCFEKALVMRRGLGGMDGRRRNGVFDMLRRRAWKKCGVELEEERGVMRVSLLGRGKRRGFRNESEVKEVMEKVCGGGGGEHCRLKLYHFGTNMSFCDQVKAMRNTDVLASTHGAQLTNMMLMPKGSSVMEMFPTGWLESAGVGQYIYQWFANWTELHYEGAWRDPGGLNCSKTTHGRPSACFLLQKDQPVGVDPKYLADWTRNAINRVMKKKSMNLLPPLSLSRQSL